MEIAASPVKALQLVARGLGYELLSWASGSPVHATARLRDTFSGAEFELEAVALPPTPPDPLDDTVFWRLAEQLMARRSRRSTRPLDKLLEFENLVRTTPALKEARALLLEQSGRLRELLYVAQHAAATGAVTKNERPKELAKTVVAATVEDDCIVADDDDDIIETKILER